MLEPGRISGRPRRLSRADGAAGDDSKLAAHDVEIRLFGDIGIIHARTSYTLADGRPGGGRYTDVWARQNGRWLCVSAHVTRL
ncbi:MAG: nuclear transport factor 2 family protein [Alphaproteobacteria bacterium]|nr:nuclear transport factor 2 family protein [Alphaproteobacteria bacterium]